MALSLLRESQRHRIMAPFGAGTTTRKSSGVDCNGFDTVLFIAGIGTITSGGSCIMTIEGADEDVDASYAALDGVSKTILDGDDDHLMCLEVVRPIHRYNRMVLDPETANVVIDLGIAILFKHARTIPCALGDTDSAYGAESFASPAEA